jgi:hypothetical protein
LVSPGDPDSISRYGRVPNLPRGPWKYDYFSHILAQQRLLLAAEAVNEPLNDPTLGKAIQDFKDHWDELRPLRDVMQHPKSRVIPWQHVTGFYDRIEYRHPVSKEVIWSYTIDELHQPVESLYSAVIAATGYDPDIVP